VLDSGRELLGQAHDRQQAGLQQPDAHPCLAGRWRSGVHRWGYRVVHRDEVITMAEQWLKTVADRWTRLTMKLPGQDSNLDKENQNLSVPRHYPLAAKRLAPRPGARVSRSYFGVLRNSSKLCGSTSGTTCTCVVNL
jgi:hypothetical protein